MFPHKKGLCLFAIFDADKSADTWVLRSGASWVQRTTSAWPICICWVTSRRNGGQGVKPLLRFMRKLVGW